MAEMERHYFIGLILVLVAIAIPTASSLLASQASLGIISIKSVAFLIGLILCLFASWYLYVVISGESPTVKRLISDIGSILPRKKRKS